MEKNYDERQLAERGKAYKYGYISAMVMALLTFLVTDALEIPVSTYTTMLLCVWIPSAIVIIRVILKDAYDGVNSRPGAAIFTLLGICGVILLIFDIVYLATGKDVFVENGVITDTLGRDVGTLCGLAVSATYFIKKYINKKNFKEED